MAAKVCKLFKTANYLFEFSSHFCTDNPKLCSFLHVYSLYTAISNCCSVSFSWYYGVTTALSPPDSVALMAVS